MRIAVGIIAIVLSLIVGFQALIVVGLSGATNNTQSSNEGWIGIAVAITLFLGGAFAFGLPLVSVILFALGGILGLASAKEYRDLSVWGGVCLILAALALVAWFGQRRAVRRARLQEEARDAAHRRLIREVAASNVPISHGFPETGNPSVRT